MKYVLDSMLYGLENFLTKSEIDCLRASVAVQNDSNPNEGIPDGSIFRFVLEKKYKLVPIVGAEDYAIITSDKELVKYCEAFGIECKHFGTPDSSEGFHQDAIGLVNELKKSQ